MKCLVIIAHPLNDSLCKALSKHVLKQLEEKHYEVEIEDLYLSDFEPAISATERASYYSDRYDQSAIIEQVTTLKEVETIILLFPTWWFGFPAILKGWFDRVWGPSVAYNHASDLGAIKPLLDNLKNVLVVTTLGSPWWVDKFIMRQPVKRILKTAILGTCAKNSKLTFLSLYKCEKLNKQQVSIFKKRIDKVINSWK